MSRRSAAFDHAAPANDASTDDDGFSASEAPTWAEDKNPTRPLPVFRLEEEARRLDKQAEAAAARCDEDATVTVSAEENLRLLASVFPADARNTDDEPTLDAPAPTSPEAMAAMAAMARPARVRARPPALTSLVITRPAPVSTPRPSVVPAAVISRAAVPRSSPAISPVEAGPPPAVLVPPPSGLRPRITPEMVAAARGLRDAEEADRMAPSRSRVKKRDMQTYLVAGIWAMALSLIALLVLMTTSA